jgi:hypothetical protein
MSDTMEYLEKCLSSLATDCSKETTPLTLLLKKADGKVVLYSAPCNKRTCLHCSYKKLIKLSKAIEAAILDKGLFNFLTITLPKERQLNNPAKLLVELFAEMRELIEEQLNTYGLKLSYIWALGGGEGNLHIHILLNIDPFQFTYKKEKLQSFLHSKTGTEQVDVTYIPPADSHNSSFYLIKNIIETLAIDLNGARRFGCSRDITFNLKEYNSDTQCLGKILQKVSDVVELIEGTEVDENLKSKLIDEKALDVLYKDYPEIVQIYSQEECSPDELSVEATEVHLTDKEPSPDKKFIPSPVDTIPNQIRRDTFYYKSLRQAYHKSIYCDDLTEEELHLKSLDVVPYRIKPLFPFQGKPSDKVIATAIRSMVGFGEKSSIPKHWLKACRQALNYPSKYNLNGSCDLYKLVANRMKKVGAFQEVPGEWGKVAHELNPVVRDELAIHISKQILDDAIKAGVTAILVRWEPALFPLVCMALKARITVYCSFYESSHFNCLWRVRLQWNRNGDIDFQNMFHFNSLPFTIAPTYVEDQEDVKVDLFVMSCTGFHRDTDFLINCHFASALGLESFYVTRMSWQMKRTPTVAFACSAQDLTGFHIPENYFCDIRVDAVYTEFGRIELPYNGVICESLFGLGGHPPIKPLPAGLGDYPLSLRQVRMAVLPDREDLDPKVWWESQNYKTYRRRTFYRSTQDLIPDHSENNSPETIYRYGAWLQQMVEKEKEVAQ